VHCGCIRETNRCIGLYREWLTRPLPPDTLTDRTNQSIHSPSISIHLTATHVAHLTDEPPISPIIETKPTPYPNTILISSLECGEHANHVLSFQFDMRRNRGSEGANAMKRNSTMFIPKLPGKKQNKYARTPIIWSDQSQMGEAIRNICDRANNVYRSGCKHGGLN
jgi:hypothetical protein